MDPVTRSFLAGYRAGTLTAEEALAGLLADLAPQATVGRPNVMSAAFWGAVVYLGASTVFTRDGDGANLDRVIAHLVKLVVDVAALAR